MSFPKHLKEHIQLKLPTLTQPFSSAWIEAESTKQFAAGIGDVTLAANYTFAPTFGWYAQPLILPKNGATILAINVEAGGGAAATDRLGWAVYDAGTQQLIDSGVFTLGTPASVTFRTISGVDATISGRHVVLAFLGGTNGVGSSNIDFQVVANPLQVLGCAQQHSATLQQTMLPWVITASTDYTSPPANLSTKTTAFSVAGVNKIHRCSVAFS